MGDHSEKVVQATIASLHADEPRDWPQIAARGGELGRLTDSPVVELNRAVAVTRRGASCLLERRLAELGTATGSG